MPEYDNSMKGVLFLEESPESDRHPNYTGHVELEGGQKFRLAGWKRVAASGKKYLSLAVSVDQPKEDSSGF